MAVQFEGGVVVGADSRTTTGSYIVRLQTHTRSLLNNPSLVHKQGQPRDR